jgi:hypothetical protein
MAAGRDETYAVVNRMAGRRGGAAFDAALRTKRKDLGQGRDMNDDRFDAWVRAASAPASRRALLAALASVVARGIPDAVGARKRKKRKKRPKPRPQEAIADQCLPSEGFVHVEITYNWAQTFVAERNGLLTRAVVELLWNEKADDAFEVVVRSLDAAGFPNGASLATQVLTTVPEVRFPDVHVLDVTFDTPPRVAAGQRFALVLSSSEGILPNNRLGDPCSGGTAFMYDEIGDRWAIQNFDLRFAAYVTA